MRPGEFFAGVGSNPTLGGRLLCNDFIPSLFRVYSSGPSSLYHLIIILFMRACPRAQHYALTATTSLTTLYHVTANTIGSPHFKRRSPITSGH
ncbi:MAG: hypothetical protein GY820_04740 [Gammaproteobacteria bacterium]|nr:hypothetical protein [Gammaproteobacteria bacterium]